MAWKEIGGEWVLCRTHVSPANAEEYYTIIIFLINFIISQIPEITDLTPYAS